jgi:hypothetical protein
MQLQWPYSILKAPLGLFKFISDYLPYFEKVNIFFNIITKKVWINLQGLIDDHWYGDLLFQGDDADCMYFIEDGECRVTVTNKVIQCIL